MANSLSFVTYSPQNPPDLLPLETACPIWRQPLSSVSGRKRYNTLDFPKENRVPTGMLRAPIGNPAPKGIFPLKSLIFLAGAYTNCKNAACNACSENAKGSLHRCVAQTSFLAEMQKKGTIASSAFPQSAAAGTGDNERGKSQYIWRIY